QVLHGRGRRNSARAASKYPIMASRHTDATIFPGGLVKPLLRILAVASVMTLASGALLAPRVSAQRRSVRLYADVVDASDAPILDLSAGDFEVLVGGTKATISKAALAREPMRIVLLVDTSEQIKNHLNPI